MEEELLNELSKIAVASLLTKLRDDGELGNFIEFAKVKTKEDGMDDEDFIGFLDGLQQFVDDDEESDVTVYNIKVEVKKV